MAAKNDGNDSDWSTDEEEESVICTLPDTGELVQVRLREDVLSALDSLGVQWNDLARVMVQNAMEDMLMRMHHGRNVRPCPSPFDGVVAELISSNKLEPGTAKTPKGEDIPKGGLVGLMDADSDRFFESIRKSTDESNRVLYDNVVEALFVLDSLLLASMVATAPAELAVAVTETLKEEKAHGKSMKVPCLVHQFFRYIMLVHAQCDREGISDYPAGPHKKHPVDVYLILRHNSLGALVPDEDTRMGRLWILDSAIETFILNDYRSAKRRQRLQSGTARVIGKRK